MEQAAAAAAGGGAATAAAAPRVGVGVIVQRRGSDEVLLGQRHGSLGDGEWALAGGHLEHGESLEACAAREVLEEAGVAISDIRFAALENVLFPSGEHYVVVFMQSLAAADAEPRVLEPEKCKGWRWVRWCELQAHAQLFRPLQQLVARGFVPQQLQTAAAAAGEASSSGGGS